MNAVFRPHTNAGTAVPELQDACGTYCCQPFDREALPFKRLLFSTLFVLVFGNRKEDLLELFNAVNNTSYQNAEEIEYNTLDSDRGFFVRLKNDLSFLIDRTMGVYEHQSSPTSANITVRMLHYYSDLLREMIDLKILYREKEVQLPAPSLLSFTTGGRIRRMRSSSASRIYLREKKTNRRLTFA